MKITPYTSFSAVTVTVTALRPSWSLRKGKNKSVLRQNLTINIRNYMHLRDSWYVLTIVLLMYQKIVTDVLALWG